MFKIVFDIMVCLIIASTVFRYGWSETMKKLSPNVWDLYVSSSSYKRLKLIADFLLFLFAAFVVALVLLKFTELNVFWKNAINNFLFLNLLLIPVMAWFHIVVNIFQFRYWVLGTKN